MRNNSESTKVDLGELVRWPPLDESDYDAVARVLSSGFLNKGKESSLLEAEWANYVGASYTIAVSSCTHAIHLALMAIGIKPGDEVIAPALTFRGTTHPIILCGAKPVFVDVLPGTYELDPHDVEAKRTSLTKAVIPVHVHGMPCDVERLSEVVPDLPIIEDACQAHGATLRGKMIGVLGHISCFSLNQVKPLGAGQGGLVVTNDQKLADKVRLLASHGGQGVVGWSYGITEFAAAVARAQLSRLDQNNKAAQANASRLSCALSSYEDLLPENPNDRTSTWHKYRLMLPAGLSQDAAKHELECEGVKCDTWPGKIVPELEEYEKFSGDALFPTSRNAVINSLIVGSETYPLSCQRGETVDRWADAILRVFNDYGS